MKEYTRTLVQLLYKNKQCNSVVCSRYPVPESQTESQTRILVLI